MSKEPKGKNNDKKSSLRIEYKGPIPPLFYCDIQKCIQSFTASRTLLVFLTVLTIPQSMLNFLYLA